MEVRRWYMVQNKLANFTEKIKYLSYNNYECKIAIKINQIYKYGIAVSIM